MKNTVRRKRKYIIDERTKREVEKIKVINNISKEITKNGFGGVVLGEDGWSDPTVGTWDPITRKAYITRDVSESIFIKTDINKPLCLDGNHHSIESNGRAGIVLQNGMQNVNMHKFLFKDSYYGIYIGENNFNIFIEDNIFIDNNIAIYIVSDVSGPNYYATIKKNKIKSNIKDSIGIMITGYAQGYMTIECNNITFETNRATGILFSTNQGGKNLIKSNKIYFKNINDYIEAPDVNIDLVGIQLENNSLNKIIQNKICFCKNEINVGVYNSYLYFDAILCDKSNKNVIEFNIIKVKRNKIAIDNTVKSREQQTVFYGINFRVNNFSNEIEDNKICISRNSISTTEAPIKYTENKFRAIFFNNNNNGNYMKNNDLNVSNNIFEIRSDAELGYMKNNLEGIYLNGNNNSNSIEKNTICINENYIAGEAIAIYVKDIIGILLSASNNESIICDNLIRIQKNKFGIGNYVIGVSLTSTNLNVIINHNCIIVKENEVGGMGGIFGGTIIALITLYELNKAVTIENNKLNESQGGGIMVFSDGNDGAVILNNSICKSEFWGIYVTINRQVVIECNNIVQNEHGGLYIWDRNNHIVRNNFINKQGTNAYVNNDSDEACYFNENYWSDWDHMTIPYNVNGAIDYKPQENKLQLCTAKCD